MRLGHEMETAHAEVTRLRDALALAILDAESLGQTAKAMADASGYSISRVRQLLEEGAEHLSIIDRARDILANGA